MNVCMHVFYERRAQAVCSALGALHVKADLRAQSVDTQTMLEKRKQKRQPAWLLKYGKK
jgi:hypothetical protein